VLRAQLEAQGIRVGGGIQVGALPAAAVELLRFKGDPVAEHVLRLNKYSNNFVAEQLVKLLGIESQGAPGSWGKGTDSLENWLAGSGLAAPGTVVADGSGLSPRNRIAPATLAKLLRRASRDPGYGPELLASLPLGGRDGTLEDRDLATVPGLRAKTGHLRAVSALSGVLHRGDGRELAFSVLVNGAPGDRSSVDAAIDRFIHGLSEPPGDSPAQLPGSGSGSAPAPGS
jgi:D-alanyl-D-alanine carboxypeptidase/D-alanyl-D-alanine-endopeptidase (penicillin-binding protein 4)